MTDMHVVTAENVPKFREWLATRGGVAVWASANLSDPGASWSTPYLDASGQPKTKPTWQAQDAPARIITDAAEIVVGIPKEVRRFRIATRMGAQSHTIKCTDASSRKIERAVEKAHADTGKPAYYLFDYATQEAVIMVDDRLIPLIDYVE